MDAVIHPLPEVGTCPLCHFLRLGEDSLGGLMLLAGNGDAGTVKEYLYRVVYFIGRIPCDGGVGAKLADYGELRLGVIGFIEEEVAFKDATLEEVDFGEVVRTAFVGKKAAVEGNGLSAGRDRAVIVLEAIANATEGVVHVGGEDAEAAVVGMAVLALILQEVEGGEDKVNRVLCPVLVEVKTRRGTEAIDVTLEIVDCGGHLI